MRFSSPKTGSFPFTRKKLPSINEESLWDTFKNAFKRVCTSTVVIVLVRLTPLPLSSAATRTSEGTEEDAGPTDKGDNHMEISSH
jgi:hypothetical protein